MKCYTNNSYDGIGTFCDVGNPPSAIRKYTVVQSLWTRPIKDKAKLRNTLYIAALSLAFAHRSGYNVNMHTDILGASLLRHFGYDRLYITLQNIPNTVPPELFAAGKFYAMMQEGCVGKVHIDIDVFLKKPGVIDKFYKDKRVDVICQQEESMSVANHSEKIQHMYVLGYPTYTRPDWQGSMNTGVVGFNNASLASKYMGNYFEALHMYKRASFEQYKKVHPDANLLFDFILEQITLSYLSVGSNVLTLVPTTNASFVADIIGYQHMQGGAKWTAEKQQEIINYLRTHFPHNYKAASVAVKALHIK